MNQDSTSRTGWQGIESAPKDGRKVNLWVMVYPSKLAGGPPYGMRYTDCVWQNDAWVQHEDNGEYSHWLRGRDGGDFFQYEPTHWMPLPDPPQAGP